MKGKKVKMKYDEYEKIANGVTTDNALDVVQLLLDKAKEDAVKSDLTEQELENSKAKYRDLQVKYIQDFTSKTGATEQDGKSPEETEAEKNTATETEIENLLKEQE